jgi:hypothetical protein
VNCNHCYDRAMRCPRCQHRFPPGLFLGGDDVPCARCGALARAEPWPVLALLAAAGTLLVSAATIGLPAWLGAPVVLGAWVTWVYTRTPVSCLPSPDDRQHLPPAQVHRQRRQRKS